MIVETPLLLPPDEDQMARIREELREDPETLEMNVQSFETWLRSQPHLPADCGGRLTENFVRLTKHDLEKAKKKFEAYVIARSKFGDVYDNRIVDRESFSATLTHRNIIVLPKLTPQGYRVVIFKLYSSDVSSFDFLECFRYAMMMVDFDLSNDLKSGLVAVFDCQNFSLGHTTKFGVSDVRRSVHLTMNVIPSRLRQIHLVNAGLLVKATVELVTRFLKEKMRKRVMAHKSLDELARHVPRAILPVDYGGEERHSEEISEDWKTLFVENSAWLESCDRIKLTGPVPRPRSLFDDIYDSFRKCTFNAI